MKAKKVLAILLTVTTVFGLSACKGKETGDNGKTEGVTYTLNELGLPVVSEPITLTVMGSKHPIQGEWSEMSLWKWLSEQTNINFEFNTPPADGYGEKKNLALGSDDLPDLFFGGGLSTADEMRYGMDQGLLIPLDTLLDVAPNIKKMFEENPDWQKSISMSDGHFYSLPQDLVGFGQYRYSWINQQWLDNLGLSMPETVDQLYEVLKQFKTGDPNQNGQQDEIPLSFTNEMYDTLRSTILGAYGHLSGSFEEVDGEIVFAPTTDEYKEYVKFMHKLWSEGLIDPESFSQTSQQQNAKGVAGKLGMFAYISDYVVVGTDIHKQYKVLNPLTSQYNSEKLSYQTFPLMTGAGAITHVNKYPEITMRLLDWFYTETGALSLIDGVEGKDWTRTDDGGMTFFVPDGMNKEEYRGGKITPDCGTTCPRYTRHAEEIIKGGAYETNAPLEANTHNQVMETIAPFAKVPIPRLIFTEEEQDSITTKSADVSTYITQTEARFIVGELDIDKEWDKYVDTLSKMGINDLKQVYEAAYSRYTEED